MTNPALSLACLLVPFVALSHTDPPERVDSAKDGIEWRADLDETLAKAVDEKRVVFIAVNIAQGEADERMAEKVYKSKRIQDLAEHTLNVVAATGSHGDGDTCERFPGIPCSAHRQIEKKVRSRILKSNEAGEVISPQSIFLGPTGEVIASVPYEVSVAELEWCFLFALSEIDPDRFAPEKSETAERPNRLFIGEVAAPGDKPRERASKKETEKLLEQLEGEPGEERALALMDRLATSEEPDARRYIVEVLRQTADDSEHQDDRVKLLRRVAEVGVSEYWADIASMLDDDNEAFVNEAIVALEQFAVPESNDLLLKGLKRAKDETLKKNLVRAVAKTAYGDRRSKDEILEVSEDKNSPFLRANALIALGDFVVGSRQASDEESEKPGEIDEEIVERLHVALWPEEHGKRGKTRLKDITENERLAAIVAMATIGDAQQFDEVLKGVLTDSQVPSDVREAASRAREIMAGELSLTELRTMRREASGDRIPRPRND